MRAKKNMKRQKISTRKLKGTPFQKKVWSELKKIPRGRVITYKELAKRIGKPRAIRAVANAVGANPCAPQIPCHRVVRSDGTLGGYSGKGGIKTKIKLLKKEGANF
jgi:methylated-DNA-[protein]-cysteine S-methyltransferase